MKKVLRWKPSASMVVATLALIVALSGTAAAAFGPFTGDQIVKKHSLSGSRLRNHTITGTQVNLNALGKVPGATNADHGTSADSATTGGSATSATNASTADSAKHASTADSATHASSATSATHASSADTAAHATTADSVTAIQWQALTLVNGWASTSLGNFGTVSCGQDIQGFVHLHGALDGSASTNGTIATLPAVCRPPGFVWLRAAATDGAFHPDVVDVQIDHNGVMTAFPASGASEKFVSLEGLTYTVTGP